MHPLADSGKLQPCSWVWSSGLQPDGAFNSLVHAKQAARMMHVVRLALHASHAADQMLILLHFCSYKSLLRAGKLHVGRKSYEQGADADAEPASLHPAFSLGARLTSAAAYEARQPTWLPVGACDIVQSLVEALSTPCLFQQSHRAASRAHPAWGTGKMPHVRAARKHAPLWTAAHCFWPSCLAWQQV